ncbi:uncharacterized protein LOC102804747 [Saccoglossus kowalevskii]|uniref:Vascular endothelial growth factor C-like n=1 Tax=Saccoglossus kowalevskii TaxID=10224 RepID=A0ABM0MFF4_SACKO|nr:PREDICTED: vascular endothelial growth factor C-like [Saccoglossus kowalevskii]
MAKLSASIVILNLCVYLLSSPVSVIGFKNLFPHFYETPSQKILEIEEADTIQDVLAILFPSEDPSDVWRTLEVREGLSASPGGRFSPGDEEIIWKNRTTSEMQEQDIPRINNQKAESDCKTPVDQIVDSYEELHIVEGLNTHIWPDCFMVQRCSDTSGCCPTGHICQLKAGSTTMVEKMFLVFTINNNGVSQTHIAMKNVTSHGDCECIAAVESIENSACSKPPRLCPDAKEWNSNTCSCECSKKCPPPYLRDPNSCVCECLHSDRSCGQVKRGLTLLPPSGCECVASGECADPACKSGFFASSQCKCIVYNK